MNAEQLIDKYVEQNYGDAGSKEGTPGEVGTSGDVKATPKSAKPGEKDSREPERKSYKDLG